MESKAARQDNHHYDTDIAIIGSGLAGLTAALTAAENGIRSIVLEKMHFIGGTGLFPEGSLGIGTRLQKESGINITSDEVFARVMEFHHWRCNAAAIRRLLNESGKTIDWLADQGVRFEGIKTLFPPEKSLRVWHVFEGRGARVVKRLTEKLKQKGVSILTKTPATRLLFSEDETVAGVIAKNADGAQVTITAKAVILATGGFVTNTEMLNKYVPDINTPGMAKLMYRGPVKDGREGDGINLALSAKAALAGMGTLAGNSPYLDSEPAISQWNGPDHMQQTRCALSQPFLWVNKHGDRFYNESYGSVFSDVYNALTSNGGLMWSILDENMKKQLVDHGPLTPFNAVVVPGVKLAALDEGISKGIESGYAFKAETIEELARKINVNPEKLHATIAKVNRYTDQRRDPDFNRKPEHLIKFDTKNGPYYALKGLRAFFLTLGGVKINSDMQALDDDDNIIPGLYATGQDMGGLYDSTYDLLAEGSASSFALSSGRLAVRHFIFSEPDHKAL